MSIAISLYSLILLFFYIVIPGFLIRRFYFRGEFSKQLNSYKGHTPNVIYSFIVGFIYNCISILIINVCYESTIDVSSLLDNFNYYFLEKDTESLGSISSESVTNHLLYLVLLSLFGILIGAFGNWLILLFKLDTKFKTLRFSNAWYYLFTGRILQYPKMSNNSEVKLKIKNTFLDVLVDENSEKPKLYSGLYADHTLKSNENSVIEKLYLLKPIRYKKLDDGRTVERPIPGDIFTIMGDTILNINCNYIFEEVQEKNYRLFNRKRTFLVVAQLITSLFFVSFSICTLLKIKVFDNDYYHRLLDSSFWIKLIVLFILNIIIGLVTPFKILGEKDKVMFIGKRAFFLKLLLLLLGILFIYFNFK